MSWLVFIGTRSWAWTKYKKKEPGGEGLRLRGGAVVTAQVICQALACSFDEIQGIIKALRTRVIGIWDSSAAKSFIWAETTQKNYFRPSFFRDVPMPPCDIDGFQIGVIHGNNEIKFIEILPVEGTRSTLKSKAAAHGCITHALVCRLTLVIAVSAFHVPAGTSAAGATGIYEEFVVEIPTFENSIHDCFCGWRATDVAQTQHEDTMTRVGGGHDGEAMGRSEVGMLMEGETR